jgi:hypothetical protein
MPTPLIHAVWPYFKKLRDEFDVSSRNEPSFFWEQFISKSAVSYFAVNSQV